MRGLITSYMDTFGAEYRKRYVNLGIRILTYTFFEYQNIAKACTSNPNAQRIENFLLFVYVIKSKRENMFLIKQLPG